MSRKEDGRRRAFYRWEFIRRNKEYKKAYKDLTGNTKDVVDLVVMSGKVKDEFKKKFFVYPINPSFTYDQVDDEYRRFVRLRQVFAEKIKSIHRKNLGKNWSEINRNLFRFKNKLLRQEVEFNFKKYIPASNKAKEEIKRLGSAQDMDQIRRKRDYLSGALHQLSAIKLSLEEADHSSGTTVINSFLADNPNIEIFGIEYGYKYVSLADSNITDYDSNP